MPGTIGSPSLPPARVRSLVLPTYGPLAHTLLELAAFYGGLALYFRLKRRRPDPLPPKHRNAVLVAAAAGALVGSRALAMLEHPDMLHGLSGLDWLPFLAGTKTIVGGLLGGLAGVEAVKAVLGETRRSGDLFVYPLLLAIAVGRVGCFLSGVSDGTAGRPSSLPWALDQGDGVPRHPTALYEILFLAALALGLRVAEQRRPLPEGALFGLFLSAYLAWRLGVDFLKPSAALALGLSAIQWACVLGLAHYARLFALGRFAPRPLQPA